MGAYLVKAAMLSDSAVFSYIEVITDFEEASCQVVVLELLGGVVLGFAGGGIHSAHIGRARAPN